jgi:hypothetical protein
MKRLKAVVFGGVLAGVLAIAQPASAIYLIPGSGLVPSVGEADPVGGAVVASLSVPFSSASLSGILTSQVISGDTANTLGGLTFTYQFALDSGSTHSANQLTASSFAGTQTDVSYLIASGINPTFFERTAGGGDLVRFYFFGNDVDPGQSSALLVIQTDALSWTPTTVAIINGSAVNVNSLAPAPVPEPSVAALLIPGLVFARFLSKRKR